MAVSIPVAAELLSVSVRLVHYMLTDGRLDSVRIGKRRLIPIDSIDAYIEANRTRAAG